MSIPPPYFLYHFDYNALPPKRKCKKFIRIWEVFLLTCYFPIEKHKSLSDCLVVSLKQAQQKSLALGPGAQWKYWAPLQTQTWHLSGTLKCILAGNSIGESRGGFHKELGLVLSQVRTSYSPKLRNIHAICISPRRTSPYSLWNRPQVINCMQGHGGNWL